MPFQLPENLRPKNDTFPGPFALLAPIHLHVRVEMRKGGAAGPPAAGGGGGGGGGIGAQVIELARNISAMEAQIEQFEQRNGILKGFIRTPNSKYASVMNYFK